MFMHGPSTHTSFDLVDIRFRYSSLIFEPGEERITGGISFPSKENALFPVTGSFSANNVNGDFASGSSGNGTPSLFRGTSCALSATLQTSNNRRGTICQLLWSVELPHLEFSYPRFQ